MTTKPRLSAAHAGCALALLLASPSAFAQDAQPAAAPTIAEGVRSLPAPALAESPQPRFGDKGQFALSIYEGFDFSQSVPSGTQLQADGFIAPHLSMGLSLGVQWFQVSPAGQATTDGFVLRLGPRIGYDFAISESVSFWPQLGVDYTHASQTSQQTALPTGASLVSTVADNGLGLRLAAPFLIHPARGFFIGAGPSLYQEFVNLNSGNENTTSIELEAVVGGAI